jgi:hypothetical protein
VTPDNLDSAAFPGLSFLQLVFGRRNLDELRHAFPDCFVAEDYFAVAGDFSPVLEALFPRQNSNVFAIA